MRVRDCRALLVVALLFGISPSRTSAQTRLEIGPLVGFYMPEGSFGHPTIGGSLPTSPSRLRGAALGAQGRSWFNSGVGLQLQVAETSHDVGGGLVTPAGYTTSPEVARVTAVSAQILYRPEPSGIPIWLSAGAGLVDHGGKAYTQGADIAGTEGLTPLAGAVGVGFDVPVGSALTATLGLSTLFYELNVHTRGGQYFERGFQTDVLPFISLEWRSRTEVNRSAQSATRGSETLR